jgi:hypothetical protein
MISRYTPVPVTTGTHLTGTDAYLIISPIFFHQTTFLLNHLRESDICESIDYLDPFIG